MAFTAVQVLTTHQWNTGLFSFSVSRPASFRFVSGQFVMLGLMIDGKPLLRAYSLVSPNYEETLEFFSIKVQNGPLTSRLQHLKAFLKHLLSPQQMHRSTQLKSAADGFLSAPNRRVMP